ncbi:hypothetical protein, variant 2 [Aphanomyces astaci]|uniref:Letm1 RBD domain-containing protein n=2 Tax=Aphanomyces astaci TaxID=112090 RepID=W4HC41_APHAT|nr:hypothetical protein H257_00516 [Aphanomyces astaci]XP_009821546.1 hypothetical protein, variant 1 [Aphanomyces astaci]XP_009821547.1 hypothetical protein, variant 2 [Aphanomyces astaci]ETV89145.1 hypothetical protein H257_00516 [Aphanomyces astaci]ETV89146.1 hypothetical protein, variant 1 [Aphanomyces astaci]ETV89147.1 hypothetical protein, variant 2 [Aphanomyces astaci]|eukprot:XP_009821545.1 hypothetical protein H257_00516 [Aphanomyces astaci]
MQSVVVRSSRGLVRVHAVVYLRPCYGQAAAMSTESPSAFQRLKKNVLDPFTLGAKELVRENREAWASRAKLQTTPGVVLTRREMFVLRQAPRDLLKSLPLLIAFAVPIAGYLAPVMGYFYPKWTLPWQFWTPTQKAQFFEEDVRQKESFYKDISQLVASVDTTNTFLRDAAASYTKDSSEDKMDPKMLPAFRDLFASPAALSALSTPHLKLLVQATSASPFVKVITYLPKTHLVQRLEKRAGEITVDDHLLLQPGAVDVLSSAELVFACEERGLVVASYNDEDACRAALNEWLSMYNVKQPVAHPPSLLLHAPILATFS